jgi:hypothetical protein
MSGSNYRTLGLSVPVSQVLDPQLWRERYAWGVRLGGTGSSTLAARLRAEGVAEREVMRLTGDIPDDVIRWHLRAAVSELELKIGTPLGVEIVKSDPIDPGLQLGRDYDRAAGRLPFNGWQQEMFYRLDLPPGVISVQRVRGYYFGIPVWTFEADTLSSVRLEWPRQGTVHIMPLNLSALAVAPGIIGGAWALLRQRASPLPDFWSVDYTRGPISKQGGAAGELELALADWCYCIAGVKLLGIGGMAYTKGLSSASVSLDGASRSVGLTASATKGINSAVISLLEDAEKRIDWKRMRAYKRGLRVIPG